MTAEIAAMPAANGRFVWRVSVAEVETSGAFSDFSGYERIIAVASGVGMHLSVDGRAPVLLTAESDPYTFPGAAATTCTLLSGAIRDFNLIFDSSLCHSIVSRLRLATKPAVFNPENRTVLIYAPTQMLTIRGASGTHDVPAGASYMADGTDERLWIAGPVGATALVAAIVTAARPDANGPQPC